MPDSTANFSLTSDFSPNFDITWSFQYAVTGNSGSNGGFSTFLFNNTTLTSGGPLTGLGFAPHGTNTGINGSVLGIMFTSDNIITVKKGTNFTTLTTFTLFESLSPFVKNTLTYNTIRFNLTDVGQTLKIAYKNDNDEYVDLTSIYTGLTSSINNYYKVGFSYSTPLTSTTEKIQIRIKDFHVHGQTRQPSTIFMDKPYSIPKAETFYIIQTPTSGHLDIAPDYSGSLLHKSK
jgi:hypothetical protein